MDDRGGRAEGDVLVVDGAVATPIRLRYEDLAAIGAEDQIADVSRLHPGREGDAVDLRVLLRLARPTPEASHLTLHAGRDDFHVSIPLAEIAERGMVVYRRDGRRLGADEGGPVRFLIRDPASCHSAALDDCANVKYLDRIELSAGPGRDTRPEDDEAHRALHDRQAHP